MGTRKNQKPIEKYDAGSLSRDGGSAIAELPPFSKQNGGSLGKR
jgi:hypothetical protein